MTRSAAKNHEWVTVVVDADDYAAVLAEMEANKGAHHARAAPQAGAGRVRAYRRL